MATSGGTSRFRDLVRFTDSGALQVEDGRILEFYDSGGPASVRLNWERLGVFGEEAVPGGALFHDPASAEPYRLGIELLTLLRGEPEFGWRRDGAALTWLVGTQKLLDDLSQDKTVEEIIEKDRADHEAWRNARASALLY